MIKKRILLFITLLGIVIVSVLVVLRSTVVGPAKRLKAEQEIYFVLLEDQRTAYSTLIDKWQLVEFTNSGEWQESTPVDIDIVDYMDMYDLPELQQETLLDFQERNKTPFLIKDHLPPTAEVILVNPASEEQLYWWVSFSAIGFNSSLTQALVLVGDCRGELCYDTMSNSMYSRGHYVLLQKKNGSWLIQDYQLDWLIEAPAP